MIPRNIGLFNGIFDYGPPLLYPPRGACNHCANLIGIPLVCQALDFSLLSISFKACGGQILPPILEKNCSFIYGFEALYLGICESFRHNCLYKILSYRQYRFNTLKMSRIALNNLNLLYIILYVDSYST